MKQSCAGLVSERVTVWENTANFSAVLTRAVVDCDINVIEKLEITKEKNFESKKQHFVRKNSMKN